MKHFSTLFFALFSFFSIDVSASDSKQWKIEVAGQNQLSESVSVEFNVSEYETHIFGHEYSSKESSIIVATYDPKDTDKHEKWSFSTFTVIISKCDDTGKYEKFVEKEFNKDDLRKNISAKGMLPGVFSLSSTIHTKGNLEITGIVFEHEKSDSEKMNYISMIRFDPI